MCAGELCKHSNCAFCVKTFLKKVTTFLKFLKYFFLDMVDIIFCKNDMLCFSKKVLKMPKKSGKNPFAFLKKSAYNVKWTLVSLT